MFDIKKFGAYISALRKKADLTQSQLAEKLHLTRQAVSKYERGLSFPDISILTMIAESFYVTLDNLIYAGEPNDAEAELLLGGMSEEIGSVNNVEEIINIVPLLNINQVTLEKIAEKFLTKGIDISNVLEFSKSLNEKDLSKLYQNATYDTVDEELLGKLILVMNNNAKMNIIAQIFDGKLNYRVIENLLRSDREVGFFTDSDMINLFEDAVILGVIDHDVLRIIGKYR